MNENVDDVKWALDELVKDKRRAMEAIKSTKSAAASAVRELGCLVDRIDLIIDGYYYGDKHE